MSTLPLTPVVNAYYSLQAISTPRSGFNLGAIVGTTIINHRVLDNVIYNNVDEMIEAGYKLTDPEILAAQVYFAASSKPGKLFVHTWIKEATHAYKEYIKGPISYGNKVTFGQDEYTLGDGTEDTTTFEELVETAKELGAEASFIEGTQTSGTLSISLPSVSTGSSASVTFKVEQGTGSEVNEVESIQGLDAESPVDTVQKMRMANSEWYSLAFCEELGEADVLAVAAYIESSSIYSAFFVNSSSDAVTRNLEDNLFSKLKGLKYSRTFGLATKKPYSHIGAMAYPMGQISDQANSSFTLGLKGLPGCTVDSYSSQEVNNVESNYGNVYINRGSSYDILEEGRVFSGAWFDEIIQLDKLANTIQLDIMDLLYQNPKIAQTESGVSRIMAKISAACQNSVKTGFIAPGMWNGVDVLNLTSGDYLPDGFLVQSESINDQSQADRDARKCPYLYVSVKLAGAIQSVTIRIDVNR